MKEETAPGRDSSKNHPSQINHPLLFVALPVMINLDKILGSGQVKADS